MDYSIPNATLVKCSIIIPHSTLGTRLNLPGATVMQGNDLGPNSGILSPNKELESDVELATGRVHVAQGFERHESRSLMKTITNSRLIDFVIWTIKGRKVHIRGKKYGMKSQLSLWIFSLFLTPILSYWFQFPTYLQVWSEGISGSIGFHDTRSIFSFIQLIL